MGKGKEEEVGKWTESGRVFYNSCDLATMADETVNVLPAHPS